RARLHHAVPVPQQLPQIAIPPTLYPDPWKVILQQQAQNVLCVLAIGLLLAFALPVDLGGVANPQFKVQFRQQSLEPARMPTGFHPHAHLLSLGRHTTVELLRCLGMVQSPLLQFSGFGIHKSNLLKGRVVICSYNDHVRLLSPGPFGWLAPPKFTRVQGADIVMESITLIGASSIVKSWRLSAPPIARTTVVKL